MSILRENDPAWREQEPPDQPTAADMDLEDVRPIDPIEDGWIDRALHSAVEDALSQADYHELLAGDIYAGTDNSDPGFYSDSGEADWGDSLSDDDAYQDWGGEA